MPKKKAGGFYAVGRGRNIGIFNTWDECEKNVKGFSGAKFKKFQTQEEAKAFVQEWSAVITHRSQAPALIDSHVSNFKKPQASKTSGTNDHAAHPKVAGKRPIDEDTATMSQDERLKNLIETSKKGDVRGTQLLKSPVQRQPTKRLRMESPNFNVPVSEKGDTCFLPFIVDSEDFVNVFTDGACPQNGQRKAYAGVGVWFGDNHPLNISQPVDGPATNNNAEIQAARLAIEVAVKAGFKKLKINTDSAFLIQCMTLYMNKWKKNDWKLSTGGDVKNRTELEKLDKAQEGIIVQWNKVPAHSGVHGNEMADKLAVEGAARSR